MRKFIKLNHLIGLVLIVQLLISALSVYFHRPLAADGGAWFFKMMYHPDFPFDFYDPHSRYSDKIWHVLSEFIFWKFPFQFWPFALRLGETLYQFHPYLSLSFCYFYLAKKKHQDLFFFPLFSFASATLPTMAFSAAVAATSTSLMWPLFFILLLGDLSSAKNYFASLVLVIMLAFSYQPIALCFAVLLVLIFLRQRNTKFTLKTISIFLFLAIGLFYTSFQLWKGLDYELQSVSFPWSFKIVPLLWTNSLLLLSGFILLQMCTGQRQFEKIKTSLFLFLLGTAAFIFIAMTDVLKFQIPYGFIHSHAYRVFAIELMTLIAAGTLFFWKRNLSQNLKPNVIWLAKLSLLVGLLIGGIADARLLWDWKMGLDKIENIRQGKPGCFLIKNPEPWLLETGFDYWSIGFTSVAMQASPKPDFAVFLAGKANTGPISNRCQGYFFHSDPTVQHYKWFAPNISRADWSEVINGGEHDVETN